MSELVRVQIDDDLELTRAMPAEALQRLAAAAEVTLQRLGITSTLTIYIAADAFVQDLNARYRGVDAPTDVLSFRAESLPPEVAEHETPYLGDVIVAYARTLAQALQSGHRPADAFVLLVVHGILHLVGEDHDTPATQQQMWRKQTELLNTLAVDISVPDFVHTWEKNL